MNYEPYFWALFILAAVDGVLIWYLVRRLNQNRKGK